MKTSLKFLAFLSLALGAFAQQGQMASSFTASSAAPHFTLNRATTAQESSIFFKTAGATTGGWRIYGSGITNQVLNYYSYQAGATVGAWSSTGLAVTGIVTANASGELFRATSTGDLSASGSSYLGFRGTNNAGALTGFVGFGGGSYTLQLYNTYGETQIRSVAGNVTAYASNALVGTFSSTGLAVAGTATGSAGIVAIAAGATAPAAIRSYFSGSTLSGIDLSDSTDTSGVVYLAFRAAGGTETGTIRRVTTTNAVVYNTTSDARLKENLRDFTAEDSGPIIDGLRPRWYDWKGCVGEDGKNVVGLIAQEEASVDPVILRIGAVSKGDDDPDLSPGDPGFRQWQRSDMALIPIILAEVKSLRARVALLESQVNQVIPNQP